MAGPLIDERGVELPPVVFPAVTARAGRRVSGALVQVETVEAAGARWWVGEDALLSPSPLTLLAQERLGDPTFIPAVLRSALHRLGDLNGSATGYCVTGLHATWAAGAEKARRLGERLRSATGQYTGIRVIAEPLGLVYSALLDNHGEIVGDTALSGGIHLPGRWPQPSPIDTCKLCLEAGLRAPHRARRRPRLATSGL